MFQSSSTAVSSVIPRIFIRKKGRTSSKKVQDEEEASQYGDEFLTEESQWNLKSQSSSDFEEDKTDNRMSVRETMPPNGDLYSSITGTTTGVTQDSESSSLLSFPKGGGYSSSYMNILGDNRTSSSDSFSSGNREYFQSRSKIVSFQDQDNGYYTSNEYIDDRFDDDDLSYDAEQPFELDNKMLKNLRAQDSPFFNDKVNVQYRDRDHFGVVTQMYGSVWKNVIPFCIFNAAWCFVIDYFHGSDIVDLNIPSSGHSFLSILLSFLVVARVQFTYARFMEARGYLGGCFNNFRELYQCVAVLTENSKSMQAKKWREKVALHLVATVRVMVAAVEFSSHGQDPYDTVPAEFHPKELTEFSKLSSKENNEYFQRTSRDKALRSPLVLASTLRQLLLEPLRSGCLESDLLPPEKLKLLGFVTNFCQSVHGLNKLITTPFSFPLVQMSRTILFFWVFTLPMAIMTDTAVRWQIAIIVFFVTYGFIGLEYVSIELDDPFGNDPNDFNSLIMAQSFYEDIYLTLYQIDGVEHAENLRRKISNKEKFLGSQKID
jgi:predicted membrane chloride channel (bestrophin family)